MVPISPTDRRGGSEWEGVVQIGRGWFRVGGGGSDREGMVQSGRGGSDREGVVQSGMRL